MRFVARRRAGVSSIVGSIFFVLIMIVAIGSLVTIFNSFTAYNNQVNQASNSSLQAADTQLSVNTGQFGPYPTSTTPFSNFNVVGTACSTTATDYTNTQKTFYAANMWWDFFTGSATCGTASFEYSTSFDGLTWESPKAIPSVITSGYAVGPYFDIEVVGTTIYLAIAEKGADGFQLGIGTFASGGSNSAPAGTITWTYAPATVTTTAAAFGPIGMAVDSDGDQWISLVQGTCSTDANCAIAIYEHQACATGAALGWEPNACTSATVPSNYAPTSGVLGALSEDTQMIIFPSITAYSATGIILVYGSNAASNTNPFGTLGVLEQSTLGGTVGANWFAVTVTGLSQYSLTSSSAVMIGTTLYFAGLAGAGPTTGTLRFWTIPFTSMAMTAATVTETVIENTAEAWEAALTSSGTTLVLFDSYPTDATIQYYTSATLGSIWSSPAITLESSETSVNGLSPASGAFAVTWFNTADNVRFAALSSFTVSNSSPFAVHVVDVYVYNPSTNTLVAHWYYNSTEEFDYWVGQGSTMQIPIRFIWSSSTSYLVTFSTDTGVTAQTTLTTLPGTTVSCPSGEYYTELTPLELCTSTSSTNPVTVGGSGTNSCSDSATAATYMGLDMSYTTSAYTSGNAFVSFSFQITTTTVVAGATTAWQLYYGAGTAPTCETAASFAGSSTAVGEIYTVRSQAAVAKDSSQTESVTLSNLAPSTTYWFDIEASDSATTSTWVYSGAHLEVMDVVSTNSPTLSTYAAATAGCGITSGTAGMAALDATFTTPSSGFSGSVFADLTFNLAETGTGSATNTAYQVHYGTGTAPTCHAGAAGVATGETLTVTSQIATTGDGVGGAQNVGFSLTGLSSGTTYWVDVEETDSSGTPTWTYSNPTLAVAMLPTAGTNLLPNTVATTAGGIDTNAVSCIDATATAYEQAGFNLRYDIPSSTEGNLLITLTFQVSIPATSAATTVWQASYGTGVGPSCSTEETGVTVGQSFTVESQAGAAGSVSQSETILIPGYQTAGGATVWVDIQAYSSTATFAFTDSTITVLMSPY